MKTGTMMFHQGWTDIINCLPLVNFFSKSFEKINLIIRDDSKPIIDYYLSQFSNVEGCYYNKFELDNRLGEIAQKYNETEILFFGVHDAFRKTEYVNLFLNSKPNDFFVKKFYTVYDIDYSNRITSFELKRDTQLEEKLYNNFISTHGSDYVLYHEDVERDIVLDKTNFNSNYKWVDLDKTTYTFFDYIKILENSKEIHLIDSVWAAIIYLLDSKYGLFKHIPIRVNCLRGYKPMFLEPIKLDNWEVI
jgi:hypothetical protein